MKTSKIWMILGSAVLLCTACKNNGEFHINGEITEAEGSKLYLEHLGLDKVEAVDSVKMSKEGKFNFSGERPECPDFYRLRINDKIITLAIDSTETVTVTANYGDDMPFKYSVDGSAENERIQQLALLQRSLQDNIRAVNASSSLGVDEKAQQISQFIDAYKDKVLNDYIISNPAAASSYFAAFQTIGGYLIFDPVTNHKDVRTLGAIATSWDEKYPGCERTQNLHNVVIQGMKNTRKPQEMELNIDENKVKETGVIDIVLPDIHNQERALTDLKGKVVLLDFTSYEGDVAKARVMQLRELYKRYHDQGFEIYQVCLDKDIHEWKTQCEYLPWVCVNASQSDKDYVYLYQVTQLPTFFIVDRNNTLRWRDRDVKDLEQTIKDLL